MVIENGPVLNQICWSEIEMASSKLYCENEQVEM